MIDRRRALMGAAKGRLPSGYQEVEWIAGVSGNISINTEFIPTVNEIVIECESNKSHSGQQYFGNCGNGLSFTGVTIDGVKCGIGVYISYERFGAYNVSDNPFDTEKRFVRFVVNNGVFTLENEDGSLWTRYNGTYQRDRISYGSTIVTGYPITIFGTQNGTYSYRDNIYLFRIYVGGEKKRDLVPCYRKSDGTIGMYDLCGSICPITNTPFYINSFTGVLNKGPDVL